MLGCILFRNNIVTLFAHFGFHLWNLVPVKGTKERIFYIIVSLISVTSDNVPNIRHIDRSIHIKVPSRIYRNLIGSSSTLGMISTPCVFSNVPSIHSFDLKEFVEFLLTQVWRTGKRRQGYIGKEIKYHRSLTVIDYNASISLRLLYWQS